MCRVSCVVCSVYVRRLALTSAQLDVSVQQELRPYDIVSFKEDQCTASIRRQADHFNTVRTNACAHTHAHTHLNAEQISLWVASEVVQVGNMSKRVHVLQTMITLASVRASDSTRCVPPD